MPLNQTKPYPNHHTVHYGTYAFICVVLSCFSQFTFSRRLQGEPWELILTFVLGAVYVLITLFAHSHEETGNDRWKLGSYLLQCLVVTVLMYVSPVQGFFNIIVLPIVSQAFFEFKWPGAVAASAALFVATVGVFWYRFGPRAIPEACINYIAAFGFTIAFTLITRQAMQAKECAEELQRELTEANQLLRAQAAQTEELATTRERNRLTREIHDGLGHYLTVVKTQLDAATALLPAQPDRAREAVAKAARLANEALEDVRRSVGSLRANESRLPLPDAIRELAAHGLPVPTVTIEGTPQPLPSAVEHALFRATQEGLTNIRKHARATSALVVLDFRAPHRICLELSDNGVGTKSGSARAEGYGLTGLRERIALLGGTVDAANRLEGGFSLRVEVPV